MTPTMEETLGRELVIAGLESIRRLGGEDLVQLTTEHVAALAHLGQSSLENAHV